MSELKLFTVFVNYVATRRIRVRNTSRQREESGRVRLVVQATDAADAKNKAAVWYNQIRDTEAGKIQFGTGYRDAESVRLAESNKCPAIEAFEERSDVLVLS